MAQVDGKGLGRDVLMYGVLGAIALTMLLPLLLAGQHFLQRAN